MIVFVEKHGEVRVDSPLLTARIGRHQRTVRKLLRDYEVDFVALGPTRFEVARGIRAQGGRTPMQVHEVQDVDR